MTVWDAPATVAPGGGAVVFLVSGLPAGVDARVVGSAPELGAWDPERAAPIHEADGVYGTELMMKEGVYAWKVVVRDGDGWRWSSAPDGYAWVRGGGEFRAEWPK